VTLRFDRQHDCTTASWLRFCRRARLDGRARVQIGDLAELNVACAKLGAIETHKKWSKDIEPDIVSGTMPLAGFSGRLDVRDSILCVHDR